MVLNHIAKIITPTDSHGQDTVRESQSPTAAKIKKKSKKRTKVCRNNEKCYLCLTLYFLFNKLHLLKRWYILRKS